MWAWENTCRELSGANAPIKLIYCHYCVAKCCNSTNTIARNAHKVLVRTCNKTRFICTFTQSDSIFCNQTTESLPLFITSIASRQLIALAMMTNRRKRADRSAIAKGWKHSQRHSDNKSGCYRGHHHANRHTQRTGPR